MTCGVCHGQRTVLTATGVAHCPYCSVTDVSSAPLYRLVTTSRVAGWITVRVIPVDTELSK